MTNIAQITDNYSVAPQLTAADFATIAEAGYKTVINFRPDAEKPGYMSASEAQKLAEEKGLAYYHIPVPMNGLTAEHIKGLKDIIAQTNDPILAHCGTGKRASVVWAFAHASEGDIDNIVSCCAKAGHNIAPLRPQLQGMKG
ncbi:MAG: TIGR01244 family phosphatase [Sphingomonadales bacterium]|nr:TIGR01244 family phosphatase [Sphingomonadales bacterium]